MPCHPARARELLRKGKSVVHRYVPFTIRLKDREGGDVQPVRLCLDPGSKTTGIAVAREAGEGQRAALFLAELHHRGAQIRKAMQQRAGYRRGRRSRNLRYRAPRFSNRVGRRPLMPSLQHRIDTTVSWVARLRRWTPVSAISMELVRFDMQAMQNPEIQGAEYQQGELAGYEVREYLLEKWGRKCAYCDVEGVPLEVEHIVPRAAGGSNRVSNLTMACRRCNERKGARPVADFLKGKPETLRKILATAKAPLKDAAAVNATRWALHRSLKATGLPVECGTGGRTKWNRTRLGVPKTHALDALCVGKVDMVTGWRRRTLAIKSTGRGCYSRTHVNASGFPRAYLPRQKTFFGFRTGDIVKAVIPKGKFKGTHVGRVAVRATGRFLVGGESDVLSKYCRVLARSDGYLCTTQAIRKGRAHPC